MTFMKTGLMAAAMIALPCMAVAQVSTDAVTDKVKDKAVDAVMDNMTTDDAMTAGKTLLKGGSKEDAAMAVVKGRVDDKIESVTGSDVSMKDLSKDGMVDAAKDMAMDKAKDAAGTKAGTMIDKAEGYSSATKYGDKIKDVVPSAAGSHVIHKSGTSTPTMTAPSVTTPSVSTPAVPAISCPVGTTAQSNGTCMVTGNWGG